MSDGGSYGGGGEFIGSVAGDIIGERDRRRARRAMEQALQDIMNARAEADPSAFANLESDPRLRTSQLNALGRLEEVGAAGGMDLGSRVALNEAAGDVSRRERGAREAILQDMAARGGSGGGASLAAQLTNQQGAADRNAAFGARAAADARARALAATERSGALAGGIRGQDWGEATDKAGALDALSRFNASQRLTKAGMQSNVRMGQAGQYEDDAERWRRRGAGAGKAAGTFIGGL